jgi:hypothetical protein
MFTLSKQQTTIINPTTSPAKVETHRITSIVDKESLKQLVWNAINAKASEMGASSKDMSQALPWPTKINSHWWSKHTNDPHLTCPNIRTSYRKEDIRNRVE